MARSLAEGPGTKGVWLWRTNAVYGTLPHLTRRLGSSRRLLVGYNKWSAPPRVELLGGNRSVPGGFATQLSGHPTRILSPAYDCPEIAVQSQKSAELIIEKIHSRECEGQSGFCGSVLVGAYLSRTTADRAATGRWPTIPPLWMVDAHQSIAWHSWAGLDCVYRYMLVASPWGRTWLAEVGGCPPFFIHGIIQSWPTDAAILTRRKRMDPG